MPPSAAQRHVYHVSPWRYLWMWLLFGPVIVFLFVAASHAQLSADRAAMLSGAALLFLIIFFITLLIRSTRLEVSEEGVAMKKIGCRLKSSWSGIVRLRVDPGHESFETAEALRGRGADKLAAAAKDSGQLFSSYDATQLALLDEHRLIPIEAFAGHLRHGKLRAQLECLAPHLQADLAALDAPQPSSSQRETLWRLHWPHFTHWKAPRWAALLWAAYVALAIPAGVLLAMSPSRIQVPVMDSIAALFQAFFALQTARAARLSFRRGSRWGGLGMGLLSLLLTIWALVTAASVADRLGAVDAVPNALAVLFFVLLAWAAAHGARAAFRRRWRVIGAILVLCAVLLGICVITTSLEFAKPHAPIHAPSHH